jgi:hypothetical protein
MAILREGTSSEPGLQAKLGVTTDGELGANTEGPDCLAVEECPHTGRRRQTGHFHSDGAL